MMLATAFQEQVPNLNLSSVMNFMNMEVDDLSSIHDIAIDKNPSSASGTSHQNSHFSVQDNQPNKSDASHQSVLPVKESTIQKSALKKLGGSRHHNSGDKSGVHDIPINILAFYLICVYNLYKKQIRCLRHSQQIRKQISFP